MTKEERTKRIAAGATGLGTVGMAGAYVTAARERQKIDLLDRRMSNHRERTKNEISRRTRVSTWEDPNYRPEAKTSINPNTKAAFGGKLDKLTGEPTASSSKQYKAAWDQHKAHWGQHYERGADGSRKNPNPEHDPSGRSQARRKKYAERMAKKMGMQWKVRKGRESTESLRKVTGKDQGRRFRPKGLRGLALAIFGKASLGGHNLLGKTGQTTGGRVVRNLTRGTTDVKKIRPQKDKKRLGGLPK